MKSMVKKNQIMITALAIMIAVAGYLNFAGNKISEEEIMTTGSENVVADSTQEDVNVASLFEISDEELDQSTYEDIVSLDSDVIMEDADMIDSVDPIAETVTETALTGEETLDATISTETPGEAVFTSTTGVEALSGAKLLKEQTRAKNKETLLEIINNVNISEEQKQEAVNSMIAITDVAEKEMASEILLEAKGFADVVVSITDGAVMLL